MRSGNTLTRERQQLVGQSAGDRQLSKSFYHKKLVQLVQ